MKNKLAKVIRTITIAPVMALILLMVIYLSKPLIFGNVMSLVLAIIFLSLFPVSAYPLQKVIPHFKKGGRDGQRTLAIITANIGYVLGIIAVYINGFNRELLMIYLTYLFSGILVLVVNSVIKVRASGHACGVTGPIAVLTYFIGAPALFGIVVIAATYWSSLQLKRHTSREFFIGSILPLIALLFAFLYTEFL